MVVTPFPFTATATVSSLPGTEFVMQITHDDVPMVRVNIDKHVIRYGLRNAITVSLIKFLLLTHKHIAKEVLEGNVVRIRLLPECDEEISKFFAIADENTVA